MRPMDLLHAHLAIALHSIAAKRPGIDRRWNYYLGRHSEKALTKKFADLARQTDLSTMFSNYCALPVDAPLSRLHVEGFKGNSEVARRVWDENDLDLEAEEVHRHALCAGESYVIVWPRLDVETGEPDGQVYDVALQDARNMHVEYASRRRRDRAWAAKVWLDGDRWRAILYYPDEIVRLQTRAGNPPGECPRDPDPFLLDELDPGAPHDFGVVPVVRFSRYFDAHSKLDDVIPIQDRINKLTADRIVAGEFGAFPQRYALTNDDPPPAALRGGPGSLWAIPPTSVSSEGGEEAKTEIGQFASTDLSNYDRTIQSEVNALFSIAQLPRHMLVNPGVAPSAQAVLADEAPMVANVRGYRDMFSAAWEDTLALCGVKVEIVWKDIEVHNELTTAQTLRELTTAGLPLDLAARVALDLPQEDLDRLAKLPVPPQPGAGLPGQAGQPPPVGPPPAQGGPAGSDVRR